MTIAVHGFLSTVRPNQNRITIGTETKHMAELTRAQIIAQRHPFRASQVQHVLDLLYGCEQCTEMSLLSAACGVTPILVCLHHPGPLIDQLTKEHAVVRHELTRGGDRR